MISSWSLAHSLILLGFIIEQFPHLCTCPVFPDPLCTLESGAAQSALSGHSIFDIALGNISSLEKKKYPPTLKRRSGIIVGFLIIILGIARCWYEYPTESYAGIFTIAVGLVIFVISIVALKEKKGI
jgi:hypothetical protein